MSRWQQRSKKQVSHRLNRLLKNSLEVKARVELAFRPASKFFVVDSEPALAGGSNYAFPTFSAACLVGEGSAVSLRN